MSRHVVLGAGPIGREVTAQLRIAGHEVTVVTRSGTAVPGADSVALAGADPRLLDLLKEVGDGAGVASIVVATNPPYHRWQTEWLPLLRNVIDSASAAGTDVVLIGNLYAYAPGALMTAATPLQPNNRKGAIRAQMWDELLAAHGAGRLRATEVRASDYAGPQALETDAAHAGRRLVEPVLAGRTAYVVGNPDAPHSWTAVADIAATVVAALGSDLAWGRPWVVPTDSPRTLRQMAADLAAAGGAAPPRVRQLPRVLLTIGGLVVPMMREMREVMYQHDSPFVCDGTETTQLLGVTPTPWHDLISSTLSAARSSLGKVA